MSALREVPIDSAAAISMNPARLYLANLAPRSQPVMAQALGAIACLLTGRDPKTTSIEEREILIDNLPWHTLRFQHTQAIRAKLAELYGAPSANRLLSALRQTLKRAWRLGLMTADEYMRAADVEGVKGDKPPQAVGRALTPDEIMALAAVCQDGTVKGARDAAMLGVAYSCGLRRAEIVNLDVNHYNKAEGMLMVKGKGNKIRTVPITNGARTTLNDWLAVRGEDPGPLFVRIDKGQRMTRARLTTQAVYYVFGERAKQAKVETFSPLDLRRTFASELLDAGTDISTVQRLMGHSNMNVTAGYDRRGDEVKKRAAAKLHFPHQRPAKGRALAQPVPPSTKARRVLP